MCIMKSVTSKYRKMNVSTDPSHVLVHLFLDLQTRNREFEKVAVQEGGSITCSLTVKLVIER